MMLPELLDPAFCGRLCLTLLHSVWQVPVLAMAAWALERLWRKRSTEQCYTFYVATLFAALAAMPLTYLLVDVDHPRQDRPVAHRRADHEASLSSEVVSQRRQLTPLRS